MPISRILVDEALSVSQNAEIVIPLRIVSGACIATFNRQGFGAQCLVEATVGTAAVAVLTQAKIDALLGSTNEVIADVAFGTTALVDNKTIGMVINCDRQISHIIHAEATGFCPTAIHYNSFGTTVAGNSDAAILNSAVAGLQVYVTSLGNIALLLNHTDLSKSTTSGSVMIRLTVRLK